MVMTGSNKIIPLTCSPLECTWMLVVALTWQLEVSLLFCKMECIKWNSTMHYSLLPDIMCLCIKFKQLELHPRFHNYCNVCKRWLTCSDSGFSNFITLLCRSNNSTTSPIAVTILPICCSLSFIKQCPLILFIRNRILSTESRKIQKHWDLGFFSQSILPLRLPWT